MRAYPSLLAAPQDSAQWVAFRAVQPDAGTLDQTLKAAQRGEVTAFNTLIQAYQRQVFNVCYRTLGNPEDAGRDRVGKDVGADQEAGWLRSA